jgi:hypothetical protein
MHNVLQDLEVAELHRHEIQVEIQHNRLVQAAIEAGSEPSRPSLLVRYLNALKRRVRDLPEVDPRKN